MQPNQAPIVKDIVLIGGGHAHVFVLKAFAMAPIPGVRLTLISPDAHTPYSGMLPGFIAGHYTYDETHIDLRPLCRYAGTRFFRESVVRLDPEARLVHCAGRPPVNYDILSIDVGSTPDPTQTPGASGVVMAVKPVAQFLEHWDALKQRILVQPTSRIGVIGGGAGGVEIALATQFALRQMLRGAGVRDEPRYTIITGAAEIMPTHNPGVRRIFDRVLAERGIAVRTNTLVDRVEPGAVFAGSERIDLDEILWVVGAYPQGWLREAGLATDDRGFMMVDEHLRSTSHPEIFGAGDIATMKGEPRPKAGVFAVRQGPPLADNLRWAIRNRPLRRHKPQRDFLSLVSTGDKYAVASRGRWALEGAWVWRWKDWIDRKFMTAFNELPPMPEPREDQGLREDDELASPAELTELGDLANRCAGCGAKLGATSLGGALDAITPFPMPGLISGLESRDDAAVFELSQGRTIVQTVDQFPAMIDDPHVFGKIAANHALGDIYAMGAEPRLALAIAGLPLATPKKSQALLAELLGGANTVLAEASCTLAGGHTSEASVLTLGFAITGLVNQSEIVPKRGLTPGQALILTKPLGTGIVFAADMRRKAKGRWMEAALASACQSSRTAAEVLKDHGATAMTDVTGFGLLGHLSEMLDRSAPLSIEISLADVPALEGVEELAQAGIVSTLAPSNRKSVEPLVAVVPKPAMSARVPLLYDPQTAGGLLAALPAGKAEACLAALRTAGYLQAAHIGIVGSQAGGKPPIRVV